MRAECYGSSNDMHSTVHTKIKTAQVNVCSNGNTSSSVVGQKHTTVLFERVMESTEIEKKNKGAARFRTREELCRSVYGVGY